jgi:hypothetical protein
MLRLRGRSHFGPPIHPHPHKANGRRPAAPVLAFLVVTALAAAGTGLPLRADDTATLREDAAAMYDRMAALEAARAVSSPANVPGGAVNATELRSLRRTASVRIGGELDVDVIVKHREDLPDDDDTVNATEFRTNNTNLRLRADITDETYLHFKFDLDGTGGSMPDRNDLVEEAQFVWRSLGGTAWGLTLGKGEVPYGMDRTLGILQSYHHNDAVYTDEGPVILNAGTEGPDPANPLANPHANVGRTAHPGEVDRVFLAQVDYTFRNQVRFEFALFQNNDGTQDGGPPTAGMYEDRSDDTLFFQSMAGRIWFQPLERLLLEVSGIRMHNESRGDRTLFGADAEDDQYAVSLGFEWAPEPSHGPLNLFGEYQHGWDWDYTDDYETDTLSLGALWRVNDRLGLGIMGEWLGIGEGDVDEDYYKLVLHTRYALESGVTFMLEYGREWFDGDTSQDDRTADVAAFRTGFRF